MTYYFVFSATWLLSLLNFIFIFVLIWFCIEGRAETKIKIRWSFLWLVSFAINVFLICALYLGIVCETYRCYLK